MNNDETRARARAFNGDERPVLRSDSAERTFRPRHERSKGVCVWTYSAGCHHTLDELPAMHIFGIPFSHRNQIFPRKTDKCARTEIRPLTFVL